MHEKKKKKLKKEGKNSLTEARRQKPLRKIEGKQQKKLLWIWIGWRERERERAFWKILNSEEHMKISCFKKLSKRISIDRKIDSIDRKLHSIDPATIEHRLSQADSNQIFNHNFNRSSNKFNRSKNRKNQNFEKQSILMQKLLKAQCFINKNALVWDEKFFKNPWI